MAITAEQLTETLDNMTAAWSVLPEDQRLSKDEDKSFFDEDLNSICAEIITRWHTGASSHTYKAELADIYPETKEGTRQLIMDILKHKEDPLVSAADLKLRLTKYTRPEQS